MVRAHEPGSRTAHPLRFFLSVDLFYMKTCAFRHAQPVQPHLFCVDEPQARYGVSACRERACPCCSPRRDEHFTPMPFASNQIHRFVNGYHAILNAPAACTTKHLIYTLACRCGQADYIGYTSASFRDCLAYHRYESNRVMREFLLGRVTTHRILNGAKSEQ